MNKPKPEPKKSDEDSREEVRVAQVKAQERAIESEQKEIVVFPESTDG